MGMLDSLLGNRVKSAGVALPQQTFINFIGSLVAANNPTSRTTDVSYVPATPVLPTVTTTDASNCDQLIYTFTDSVATGVMVHVRVTKTQAGVGGAGWDLWASANFISGSGATVNSCTAIPPAN
jgi:hypothetical protein